MVMRICHLMLAPQLLDKRSEIAAALNAAAQGTVLQDFAVLNLNPNYPDSIGVRFKSESSKWDAENWGSLLEGALRKLKLNGKRHGQPGTAFHNDFSISR